MKCNICKESHVPLYKIIVMDDVFHLCYDCSEIVRSYIVSLKSVSLKIRVLMIKERR